MKRAASRPTGGETPSKLSKRKTSTTLSRTPSSVPLPRTTSKRGRPPTVPRFPTLKPSGPLPDMTAFGGAITVPGLRRAPTVTLADGSTDATTSVTSVTSGMSARAPSRAASKASSKLSTVPSLKKVSSKVEGEDVVTSIKRLPSGSSTGKTTSFAKAPPEVRKELSRGAGSLKKAASLAKSASVRSSAAADRDDAGETTSDADAGSSLPVPLPPGGLVEIVFSFDTTGSMSRALDEVRGRVQDMIQRLQADIPSIRIAVFAHGDYCDADIYVTKWMDFGASTPELCNFVKTIEPTGGGDVDECYELVLRQVQEELSWTPGSQRSLVMIGDAQPHPPTNSQNKLKIDWKQEVKKLAAMGVKIYAVQANKQLNFEHFYRTMAAETGGRRLELSEFRNIFDIIMAICYCEHGVDFLSAYEDEVRERHKGKALPGDLEGVFDSLRDPSAPAPPKAVKKPSIRVTPVTFAAPKPKGKAPRGTTGAKTKTPRAPRGSKTKGAGPGGKGSTKKGGKATKKRGGKQRRETISDKAFTRTGLLKRLKWSPWRHVISTTNHSSPKQAWGVRAKGSKTAAPGWRRHSAFKGNASSNCIYEVAVSSGVGKRPRKYVMHYVPAQKLRSDVVSNLLRNKQVAKEIDALLKAGPAEVFVRCGVFKTTRSDFFKKVLKYLQDNFNYAWRAKPHRLVKKGGKVLSGNI